MNGPDIDGTLPGQEVEVESSEDEVRREADSAFQTSESSSAENWDLESTEKADALRGWLYLTAGAGYSLLFVYLLLVIKMEYNLPVLSDGDVVDTNQALTTAILISVLVYITIWFFMSGKQHSFFTEDPDKAKFYAGIIGLAALVIISLSWAEHSREMIVSAILTSVSTWSYIRSSEMKT
jgi:hypothetical protein